MLTYRGDKFVRGKKFTINESVYRFSKRDNDKLIFEAISDGSRFVMTEDEFNKSEKILIEKINQENKEINDIIGQVLRSKSLARKYEDKLKSYGIDIDFNKSQGVTLTGSNGKHLSATSSEVRGPARPGHAATHEPNNGYSTRNAQDALKAAEECEEEVNKIKGLDEKGLLKYFHTTSTNKATTRKKEEIERLKKLVSKYRAEYEEELPGAKEEARTNKLDRRIGHETGPFYRDTINYNKDKANATIDYLNYLTKPDLGKPYKDSYRSEYSYGEKNEYDPESGYYDERYFGRNQHPDKNETLETYKDLNDDIDNAKEDLNYDNYMTDKKLQDKIAQMQKSLDKRIENLKKDNQGYKEEHDEHLAALREKRKALRDFLKSKGVREAILSIINGSVLNESEDTVSEEDKAAMQEGDTLNSREGYKEIYGSVPSYLDIPRIIDALHAICEQAEEDGFSYCKQLNQGIRLISNLYEEFIVFYESK